MNQGVYKIINTVTGKYYIGSSSRLKSRKQQHFDNLKRGVHHNKHLQSSYNKYGKDNFIFEVLEYIVLSKDVEQLKNLLLEKEQYWIDSLKANNPRYGYNKRGIAESNLGIEFSHEHKNNLSKALKGRNASNKGIPHTEETKVKLRNARKLRITKDETRIKLSEALKNNKHCLGYKHTEEMKIKVSKNNPNRKRVINVTTGLVFQSMSEASKFYGIPAQNIGQVCKNKRKIAGGYLWKYFNEGDTDGHINFVRESI